MKRTWTIIGVGDVLGSLKWYQALFGQPATLPAHDFFGQILDSDGTVLLCLHEWGAHEHPSLMSPDHGTPGNGLLLFFRVDDFDLALQRARSLITRLEEEPHVNPNTQTKEISLRDPDGYYVTISALSAASGLGATKHPALGDQRRDLLLGQFDRRSLQLSKSSGARVGQRQFGRAHGFRFRLEGSVVGWLSETGRSQRRARRSRRLCLRREVRGHNGERRLLSFGEIRD